MYVQYKCDFISEGIFTLLVGTMTDVFYETLQKEDSERCMSIVQEILVPHGLNDSK